MRSALLMSILVVLAGCDGKKKKDPAPTPKLVPIPDAAVAATPDAATLPTKDERCASPCRFLADTPLAEVGDKVRAACGSDWPAAGDKDCAQLDYQRNCIYATAGYAFKKKAYQDAFGKEPWYKARADYRDADLSKVATANIAELKKRAGECRKGDAIDARDRKIVDAWLDKVRAGKPEVPPVVLGWGGTAESADEMKKALVANKAMFAKKMERGMRYVDIAGHEEWKQPLAGKTVRKAVEIDLSDPGDETCEDECGYGHIVLLVIDDKDQIIGMAEMFAACPSVYLGDAYQGEILRSFAFARREATQTLAVVAPCDGRVVYRIAEEKRETTYLDSIVLEIGGEQLLPVACGALCANDGRYEVIAPGASIDVAFDIPGGLPCGDAKLRANGHYVPF